MLIEGIFGSQLKCWLAPNLLQGTVGYVLGESLAGWVQWDSAAPGRHAVLCFVDLDDFVTSEAPGQSAGNLLRKAFARRKVGAVGMHWRHDERCELMVAHAGDLHVAMANLDRQLRGGSHSRLQARGAVYAVSPRGMVGWLADAAVDPVMLSVTVCVNGHWQGQRVADLQRPNLVKTGVSRSGRAGFHFRFEAPLPPGDVVQVRGRANPTALARDTHVIG